VSATVPWYDALNRMQTQVFQDRITACSGRSAAELRAAIGQMRTFDVATLHRCHHATATGS